MVMGIKDDKPRKKNEAWMVKDLVTEISFVQLLSPLITIKYTPNWGNI